MCQGTSCEYGCPRPGGSCFKRIADASILRLFMESCRSIMSYRAPIMHARVYGEYYLPQS